MGDNTFSIQLQTLRKKKGITQEQLAQSIGVTPQAVSKWENGGYPDGSLIPKIAGFFGVSTDFLYGLASEEKQVEQRVLEELKKVQQSSSGKGNKREVFERMLDIVWAMIIPMWEDNEYYWNIPDGKNLKLNTASLVNSEGGFELLRFNCDARFAFISSEAEGGYGKYFKYDKSLAELFAFMGNSANLRILYYLNSITPSNFFTAAVLQTQLGLSEKTVEKAIEYLISLGIITECALENGKGAEKTMIYNYRLDCSYSFLIMLQGAMLMLKRVEAFQMQVGMREKPIFDINDIDILNKVIE